MDSFFESGIKLKGTLRVKGVVHMDGEFVGEVFSSNHFIVGKNGNIHGNITAHNLTNMGTIRGNIFSENKVTLMAGCRLKGDISSYHLVIDEGSNFEGLSKKISPPENVMEPEGVSDKASRVIEPKQKSPSGNNKVQNKSLKFKAALVGLGLLAVGFGGNWLLTPNNDVEALVKQGYQSIEESRVAEAEAIFKKA